MNPIDSVCERLLQAAAGQPSPLPACAPLRLEARVLAVWRERGDISPWTLLLPLLRRAGLCACAIIVIATAVSFHLRSAPPPNELVAVDSLIQLSLLR